MTNSEFILSHRHRNDNDSSRAFWNAAQDLFAEAGFQGKVSDTGNWGIEAWMVGCDVNNDCGSTRLLIIEPEYEEPQYVIALQFVNEGSRPYWHELHSAKSIQEVKALIEKAISLRNGLGFRFKSLVEMKGA